MLADGFNMYYAGYWVMTTEKHFFYDIPIHFKGGQ